MPALQTSELAEMSTGALCNGTAGRRVHPFAYKLCIFFCCLSCGSHWLLFSPDPAFSYTCTRLCFFFFLFFWLFFSLCSFGG